MSAIRPRILEHNPYVELHRILKVLYQIPSDSLPCKISIKENDEYIQQLLDKGIVAKGKTVVLNPYASSQNGVPQRVFEKIAKTLNNERLTIITSAIGSQIPISGTRGLNFPLNKSVELSNACGFVIGIRSGFMDLQTFSSAKIVTIDSDNYILSDICEIEKTWPENKNTKSFRYAEDKEDEIVQGIVNFILQNLADHDKA